ncbi:5'/3'-nucleotidase SurE [Pseudoramibacter sp.]|jgi:5'-nucleotidase|uniref:5'/3'-nucleotidase SurE n=1 Tax=Pseudoramibacter sp. TaxID=2034862 RepID=UPI0025F2C30E|nr:5'/3'-nucleotidase SurE [Pseudoramibacter sp.]MCH4071630.1 5'/3'-nucleotidase SurE [Pseudoramibacter sp.]MCH4105398.1 5'/3'-nucleotidase SurE [Pseudoramibacter sp.]
MNILLSNDDGFDAPGIHALAKEMKKLGHLVISAPADPQSAKSHSKAVRGQLKVHAEPFEPGDPELQDGYRVFGTPYDSVDVALHALLTAPETRPDLVVTGINHGSNVAYDILHSGTIGASSAARFGGIPVIAMSLNGGSRYDYRYSAKYALKIAKWFVNQPDNTGYILSVNTPNCPESEIKGTIVSRMGHRHNYTNTYAKTVGEDENTLYFDMQVAPNHEDTDEDLSYDDYAVNHGYVVITPLDMDVTDFSRLDKFIPLTDTVLNPEV